MRMALISNLDDPFWLYQIPLVAHLTSQPLSYIPLDLSTSTFQVHFDEVEPI